MMANGNIPIELNNALSGEIAEFMVKSNHSVPLKTALVPILFGLVWLGFTSIFIAAFFGPVLMGKEVHFTSNDVPTTAGPGNLEPLLGPGLLVAVFLLVGLAIFGYGLYLLIPQSIWFAGTSKRLVILQKNKVRSIDWEQFSGDIEVSGNSSKGDISLGMRTGQMVNSKHSNHGSEYIPEVIYMIGIPNAFTVEQVCRRRIKENDPAKPQSD
jgi:hypothetical protein